jgi:hypothetical protein
MSDASRHHKCAWTRRAAARACSTATADNSSADYLRVLAWLVTAAAPDVGAMIATLAVDASIHDTCT